VLLHIYTADCFACLFCALRAAVWKSILTDKLAAAGFPSPAIAKEGDGKITGENEVVFCNCRDRFETSKHPK
jgi:hypothetical protein